MRSPPTCGQLGAKGKKLIGRSLLEVVGVNVSNIRPCNWQCICSIVPCIKISVIGQAHGLGYVLTCYHPRGGCLGLKYPSDQALS